MDNSKLQKQRVLSLKLLLKMQLHITNTSAYNLLSLHILTILKCFFKNTQKTFNRSLKCLQAVKIKFKSKFLFSVEEF